MSRSVVTPNDVAEAPPAAIRTQPRRKIVTFEVLGVGRIRLVLTPRAYQAARIALDRGDIARAVRLALASAPK